MKEIHKRCDSCGQRAAHKITIDSAYSAEGWQPVRMKVVCMACKKLVLYNIRRVR